MTPVALINFLVESQKIKAFFWFFAKFKKNCEVKVNSMNGDCW